MSCLLITTLGSLGFTSLRLRVNPLIGSEFKTLIENQAGRHIRILRSDNGCEYESNEFDDQTLDVPENIESPLEELLEVPPSKKRPAWY